jgi:hypothetical protein
MANRYVKKKPRQRRVYYEVVESEAEGRFAKYFTASTQLRDAACARIAQPLNAGEHSDPLSKVTVAGARRCGTLR